MESALAAQNVEDLLNPAKLAEIRRLEIRSRRSLDSSTSGNYRSAFRGSGLVFSDLREYMPGDDVKHIHWKITARSGKVYIKSYEEERQLNVMLALDISRSTISGGNKMKYQRSLEFAALISLLAKQNSDALGLCLFSDRIEHFMPVSKSRSQFKRVVFELVKSRSLRPETDIGPALSYMTDNLKKRSVIFLVSDFYSPDYSHQLKLLSRKHDVICALVEDRIDFNLPAAGLVEFTDAESGERLVVDCSNSKTSLMLKKFYEKRIADWQNICRSAGCDSLIIGENPLAALQQLMKRRTQRVR